jgi:hypothetical protein
MCVELEVFKLLNGLLICDAQKVFVQTQKISIRFLIFVHLSMDTGKIRQNVHVKGSPVKMI